MSSLYSLQGPTYDTTGRCGLLPSTTVVHNLPLGERLLPKVFRCHGLGYNCRLLDGGSDGSDLPDSANTEINCSAGVDCSPRLRSGLGLEGTWRRSAPSPSKGYRPELDGSCELTRARFSPEERPEADNDDPFRFPECEASAYIWFAPSNA